MNKVLVKFPFGRGALRLRLLGILFMFIGASGLQAGDINSIPLQKLEGGEVTLADFKGKTVLVNFWATWCIPCRKEFPELDAIYKELKDQGLVILGVTADTDKKIIRKFLSKTPVSFPILIDASSEMHEAVNIEVMPSTILLDKNGKVAKTYLGFDRLAGLGKMKSDIVLLNGGKS